MKNLIVEGFDNVSVDLGNVTVDIRKQKKVEESKETVKKLYVTLDNLVFASILADSLKSTFPGNVIEDFAFAKILSGQLVTIGFEINHATKKVDITYRQLNADDLKLEDFFDTSHWYILSTRDLEEFINTLKKELDKMKSQVLKNKEVECEKVRIFTNFVKIGYNIYKINNGLVNIEGRLYRVDKCPIFGHKILKPVSLICELL